MRTCILALLISSCYPLHIERHEAVDVAVDQCGRGSTASFVKPDDIEVASIELIKGENKELDLSVSFWGIAGKKIAVAGDAIKVRYADGENVSIAGKLINRKVKEDPTDSPKETEIAFATNHTFKTEEDYPDDFVILQAKIPFKPVDIEIEIPKVTISSKAFAPLIYKFKFVDHWTFVALNGC